MKQSMISLGDKVLAGVDRLQKKIDMSSVYLSAVLTAVLIVTGVWGTVRGDDLEESEETFQNTTYIDVNASYKAQMGKVYSATGDEGQNIQTLDDSSRLSSGMNLLGDLAGIEVYGPEAVKRSASLDLPESTRIGLLGVVDKEVIALAYNPPGVDLDDHLARQWVPGYEEGSMATYAQETDGFGFLKSNKFEELWKFMRNIAYSIFVVIIMASGFMVMFRTKLANGQAVSVINALPGIFMGLLMVTFSFAIVGFIIDIGRLLCMVVGNQMKDLSGGTVGTVYIGDPIQMAKEAFTQIGGPMTSWAVGGTGVGVIGIMGILGSTMSGALALVGVVGVIVLLVLAGIALYAAVRVYMTLVMAYIKILIELIFSPLYIVLGSLPGRSDAIMQWIKRVFSHVLVFPVVIFMLNLAAYIRQDTINVQFNRSLQFLSATSGGVSDVIPLRGIIVIAIYLMAAGAPAIVSEIVGAAESKGAASMFEDTKRAAGKIPVVGGLFG